MCSEELQYRDYCRLGHGRLTIKDFCHFDSEATMGNEWNRMLDEHERLERKTCDEIFMLGFALFIFTPTYLVRFHRQVWNSSARRSVLFSSITSITNRELV